MSVSKLDRFLPNISSGSLGGGGIRWSCLSSSSSPRVLAVPSRCSDVIGVDGFTFSFAGDEKVIAAECRLFFFHQLPPPPSLPYFCFFSGGDVVVFSDVHTPVLDAIDALSASEFMLTLDKNLRMLADLPGDCGGLGTGDGRRSGRRNPLVNESVDGVGERCGIAGRGVENDGTGDTAERGGAAPAGGDAGDAGDGGGSGPGSGRSVPEVKGSSVGSAGSENAGVLLGAMFGRREGGVWGRDRAKRARGRGGRRRAKREARGRGCRLWGGRNRGGLSRSWQRATLRGRCCVFGRSAPGLAFRGPETLECRVARAGTQLSACLATHAAPPPLLRAPIMPRPSLATARHSRCRCCADTYWAGNWV